MDYSQFLYMREELSLLAVILIVFVVDLFLSKEPALAATGEAVSPRRGGRKGGLGLIACILLGVHTVANLVPCCGMEHEVTAFGGMYVHTAMMTIVKSVLNVGTLVVFLMANGWLRREENRVKQGEFYLITLFTLLGMYFMISSGHFLMFFIGLELASVPLAALVAFDKWRYESAEAGAKFILLALFSSALLLYGVSLIYGATGTLYFTEIGALISGGSLLSILGLVLFMAGMGFKISLVPFHLWTADTYQGAPTVVTGYLSVVSKGAASFVLMTVLMKAFADTQLSEAWNIGLFWLIVASITIANLFAVRQQNLKRFMAFSAISQAGYLVLAVMGGTAQGMTALVYYLLVYMVADLGAFAIINVIEQNSGKINIDDYDGLYETNPKLAFLMTLCLFSLAGIPPFAGMFSKFFVFMAAFNAGYQWLVLIALINTVISLYYYLLIVKAMYIKTNETPIAKFRSDNYTRLALFICLAGVVLVGILGVCYNYIDTFAYGME
ncbi:MAG: NADH-quinone oxidoreductase subunit N [Alloprevotella sp.]|nr:NADH-quinone oxidoreductase subunit N [Alloprevotella sp.]